MVITRTVALGTAVAGLVSAGLLSLAVPAGAADANLTCESGTGIFCSLDNAGSSANWTLNGYPASGAASYFNYRCLSYDYGHWFTIAVSYTNSSGQPDSATARAQCLRINP